MRMSNSDEDLPGAGDRRISLIDKWHSIRQTVC
jgi:hypothetical protein